MATARGLLPLLAGVASLTLVGCTSEPGGVEPPAPATAGTGAATAAATAVTAAPAGEYPADPQEYAEAVVGALAAPDLARLGELVTPGVRTVLLELPGPPQAPWRLIDCAADGPTESCGFYNAAGDQLTVRVDRSMLGQARAATGVDFDPIDYPDDDRRYLAAFLDAWQDGNLARMNALAVPAVVAVFRDLSPESVGYSGWTTEGRRSRVVVRTSTAEVSTEISAGRLGRGQAVVHAAVVAG